MPTLHFTRGLPASGKTTWARVWTAEHRGGRARVNRDDLRTMLDSGEYLKGVTEQRVIAIRDAAILDLLHRGYDVVCDDTTCPIASPATWPASPTGPGPGLRCMTSPRFRFRPASSGTPPARHRWARR